MVYVQSWLAHRASPQAEVVHLHHACNGRRSVLRIAHRGVQASAHRIALLPGDGIGPEIADVAVRLLRAAGELEGESFEVDEGLVGGAAIDATGQPLPAETLQLCRDSDAVLLAAIGGCGPTGACRAGRGTAGGPAYTREATQVQVGRAHAGAAAGAWPAEPARGPAVLCQPAAGHGAAAAGGRVQPEARGGGGRGHHDRARAGRRHLFRPAQGEARRCPAAGR